MTVDNLTQAPRAQRRECGIASSWKYRYWRWRPNSSCSQLFGSTVSSASFECIAREYSQGSLLDSIQHSRRQSATNSGERTRDSVRLVYRASVIIFMANNERVDRKTRRARENEQKYYPAIDFRSLK